MRRTRTLSSIQLLPAAIAVLLFAALPACSDESEGAGATSTHCQGRGHVAAR